MPVPGQAARPEPYQNELVLEQSISDDGDSVEKEKRKNETERRAVGDGKGKMAVDNTNFWPPHTHCSKRFCTVWHMPNFELKDNAITEKSALPNSLAE